MFLEAFKDIQEYIIKIGGFPLKKFKISHCPDRHHPKSN